METTKLTTHGLSYDALENVHAEVESGRNEILKQLVSPKSQPTLCKSSNILVADAGSPTYFKTLERFPEIRTVFYKDSLENISRYLRPKYYHYMSNDCELLESKSKGGHNTAKLIYGAKCLRHFNESWQGYGLKDKALGVGLPPSERDKTNVSRVVTLIHVIPEATSFSNGDVVHDNLKIVPLKCERNLHKSCSYLSPRMPKYKEVFTISQFWGSGFYHAMLEDLPRIAPYLTFLQKEPQIRIHVASRMEYLNLLGIDNSRLITTPAVHADVVYMPTGGPCGTSPLFTTQLLANFIINNSIKSVSKKRGDTIILIKRSQKRWFSNHDAILRMLKKHASHWNLTVEVFGDDPLPDVPVTIDMFSRALVVVAPHGAGEANLILSRPGTLLIEGLCYDDHNLATLCYRNMAQALGLRYYGLIYRHQCMKITPEQIERPLMEFFCKVFEHDSSTL